MSVFLCKILSAAGLKAAAVETAETETVAMETITSEVAEQISEDLEKVKPSTALDIFKNHLPSILAALYQLLIIILIIIIANRLIKLTTSLINKSLGKMKVDKGISKFLISVFRFFAYAIVVFIVAERLGINSASIITVIGSVGIAIGLALQGSLSNVAGGIIILVTKPFKVGDYIILEDIEGTVKIIDIVYTTLVTYDNKKVSIPNASLSSKLIVNSTAYDKRLIEIKINVSYETDIVKVKNILKSVYEEHENIIKNDADRKIMTYLESYNDSALTMGVRGWCNTDNFISTKWDIQEKIKLEFDKNNIDLAHKKLDVYQK